MPKVHRIHRKLTDRERQRYQRLVAEVDAEKDDMLQQAREAFDRMDRIDDVVEALTALRRAKGLTVTEVARRAGMHKPNVTRLESVTHVNPTLDTLLRYAEAIGAEIRIAIIDTDSGQIVTAKNSAA
jgi:DNA-binding phage protein